MEGAKSFNEIEIRLNRFTAQKQPKHGEWIVGFDYDHNNMLHSVWCAVIRMTKQDVLLGESERITPYKA